MFERFGYMPEAQIAWKKYALDLCNIFNCSVGGDRICNVLYRLKDMKILDRIKGGDPKLCVILVGANDIEKTPVNVMVEGTKSIVQHVKTKFPSTKVVLLGMYPRQAKKIEESVIYQRVQEFNSKLEQYANETQIQFEYYGDDILDKESDKIWLPCLVDLVHFSALAYSKFARRLSNLFVENKLKQPR